MNTVNQELQRKLTDLINAHSAENDSNTPDHILAEYMMACLDAFNHATKNRDEWYDVEGRQPAMNNHKKGEIEWVTDSSPYAISALDNTNTEKEE